MADAKTWTERISEWRASGLSAVKFSDGRGFSAHQLWSWRAKLRKEEATVQAGGEGVRATGVRLARVVRVAGRTAELASGDGPKLVVELLGLRVMVPAGFDRATFSMVLDEVAARRSTPWGQR